MPRTWSSLANNKAGEPLYFWYCPKCGVAYYEDCTIIEEESCMRLKHKCGSFLKPILNNLVAGYSVSGLETAIDRIRRESKEHKKKHYGTGEHAHCLGGTAHREC